MELCSASLWHDTALAYLFASIKAPGISKADIKNEGPLAEEFESTALKVEKVIGGGQQGRLRPLEPGRYPFMGEYHPGTVQGVVIAQ